MSTTIYSAADAAKEIGCDPATIRRHCAGKEIGTRLGRDWALTDADLEKLRGIVRPGPGNPAADSPGNKFFGGTKPTRKRTSAKRRKKTKK